MRGRASVVPVVALLCGAASAVDLPEVQRRRALHVLVSADESPEAFSFEPGGPPGFERELLEGLRQALDEYLAAARRSGSWSRLVIRYYGENAFEVLGRGPGR